MSKHKNLNKIKIKWLIPGLLLITNFSLITANLFFTIERELDHIKHRYTDRLNRSLTRVQHTVEYALKKNHQEWVQKEISTHGSDPELIELLFVDSKFKIKASTQRSLIGDNALDYYGVNAPNINSKIIQLIDESRRDISNKTFVSSTENQIISVFPVSMDSSSNFLGNVELGMLVARIDLTTAIKNTKLHAADNLLFISLGLILLTFFLVYFLNIIVTKRLSKITHITKGIAGGLYGVKADVSGNDEIGELAESINMMSQLLQENKEQLNQELVGRTKAEQKVRELNKELELHIQELKESNQMLESKAVELERASKFKSEFLANMSHELRTPLNSIIGFTTRIINRYGNNIETRVVDSLETIQSNGKHLLALINDLLDFSKIEAGKMEIVRKPVELVSIINDVRSAFEHEAEEKSLSLEINTVPDVKLNVDVKRFKQILFNLMSNAIKFTDQGSVSLDASKKVENDMSVLELVVSDTGIGISEENQSRLFTKFEQLDDAETNTKPGTGLGLVLAKELTELHDGTIDVKSEKGKGTSFSLTFPVLN